MKQKVPHTTLNELWLSMRDELRRSQEMEHPENKGKKKFSLLSLNKVVFGAIRLDVVS